MNDGHPCGRTPSVGPGRRLRVSCLGSDAQRGGEGGGEWRLARRGPHFYVRPGRKNGILDRWYAANQPSGNCVDVAAFAAASRPGWDLIFFVF